MTRVFNFIAGAEMCPREVLQQTAEKLRDCNDCGMSVTEMSQALIGYMRDF